jgi:hypothetical protein
LRHDPDIRPAIKFGGSANTILPLGSAGFYGLHLPVEFPAGELRCILLARQVHLIMTLIVSRIGVFKNGGIPA